MTIITLKEMQMTDVFREPPVKRDGGVSAERKCDVFLDRVTMLGRLHVTSRP